jgi:hypothetical protein
VFLSDYGHQDEFVGVCHGVIARLCPAARVIDLTHGVRRHNVRQGAMILARSLQYTPPAAVVLAVVDPGVGGARRAVALRLADDRIMVGPDNGLLSLAAARAGGVVAAVDLAASPWRLDPVSATFHGRDIFAPVAARLAAGEPLDEAGHDLDPAQLIAIELPRARRESEALVAPIVGVDAFGNLELAAVGEDLRALGVIAGEPLRIGGGNRRRQGPGHAARYGATFSDVAPGELVVYEDATGALAIAVAQGDAAGRLGLGSGDQVRITGGQ